MAKKRQIEMTEAEIDAIESTDHTVSITLSGPEYRDAMMFAQHRGVSSVEEYLTLLYRETRTFLFAKAAEPESIEDLEREAARIISSGEEE